MTNRNVGKTRYGLGEWVTFFRWPKRGVAQVIELRGPLGRGGEQVYRLRENAPWGEVREFEQAESDLEPGNAPCSVEGQPAN
jgi:hypothetical protein